MYIQVDNLEEEHRLLAQLADEGLIWVDDTFPMDFKLSLSSHFRGFPYELKIINETIRWSYDLNKNN